MAHRLLISFLCVFCCTARGQSVSTLMGSRAQGLGFTTASLYDTWGIFNNVAGVAKTTQTSASFAYDARPQLVGANRTAAALLIPSNLGVAAVGVFRFGDDVYSESLLTAGFSNQLGIASLGVRINYIQYRAEGFGSKGVFTIGFGGIAELTPELSVGAYITNINQPEVSMDGDQVPTLLNLGFAFTPTEKVFIAAELEKDLEYRPTWKMGGEYQFHPKFSARTGFNLYPNATFFGFGFKSTKFHFDYALQYSTALMFSHQASVNYQFIRP
jgi:hypothetical protein